MIAILNRLNQSTRHQTANGQLQIYIFRAIHQSRAPMLLCSPDSKNQSAPLRPHFVTIASPYLSAHFVHRDDAFAGLLSFFGLDLIILRYRVHQPR